MRIFVRVALLLAAVAISMPAGATTSFNSGSTGVDGNLDPASNVALQVPESGFFNYSTVNVRSGVTVTFQKNSKNTPVTILAKGNVTISGTVSLNGAPGSGITPGVGGPGGFIGGVGGPFNGAGFRGQGPGSGGGCLINHAGGGSFGTTGLPGCSGSAGNVYGNAGLIPLIGGSGGGGGSGNASYAGGGGGGGAILIASSGIINVIGSITANGGMGSGPYWFGGGGSGGAIRLIANTVTGEGTISAAGGPAGAYPGGDGRIRFEAWNYNRNATTTPTYSLAYPPAVYPAATPTLTITTINDSSVVNAAGAYRPPDILLPANSSSTVNVLVTATNIPVTPLKTVTVWALPEIGTTTYSATGTLVGTLASSSVTIPVTVSNSSPSLISASVNY